MEQELFRDVVGQYEAKKKLGFFLDAYASTKMVPNMLLVAPKGNGKSMIAREIAKGLTEFDEYGQPVMIPSKTNPNEMKRKRKTFIEVNCASLKNVKTFFQQLIIPAVQGKMVTLFLDEASELEHSITMALLTILNNNATNQTTYSFEDYVCEFDWTMQTFIFASSEPSKLFYALTDRLERVDLQHYSNNNLAEILRRATPGVEYEDGVDEDIASTLRGNARASMKAAGKVLAYLKGSKVFMREDWESLKSILSVRQLGLTPLEINLLQLLASHPKGSSLTALAARSGLSRTAIQQDTETWLLRNDLMMIESSVGRTITAKGLEYLKNLPANI